jgi:hypothetical protein
MNITDDKSISLMSTTAMKSKSFIGSVESELWRSQLESSCRKDRILEVRRQESSINREKVSDFQLTEKKIEDDGERGRKFEEYREKKLMIER